MKKLKPMSFEKKQNVAAYLFCLPLIIGAVTIFIPNIIKTFYYSICEMNVTVGGFTAKLSGFGSYYEALFKNEKFNTYVISTLGDMLINLPVILIFSLFVASLLNQRFIGRTFVRSVFFLPIILSTGIVVAVQADTSLGALTTGVSGDALSQGSIQFAEILKSFNIPDGLMKVIVSSAGSVASIITASSMQILLFLTAFQEISPEYYEAAKVDGCSTWEQFWKITIPIMMPQIIVNAVYTITDSFVRSNSLFRYINGLAFDGNQYSLATAMYFLYLLALSLVLFLLAAVALRAIKLSK